MRKKQGKITDSELKNQQELLMASLNDIQNTKDKLEEENSSLLLSIKENKLLQTKRLQNIKDLEKTISSLKELEEIENQKIFKLRKDGQIIEKDNKEKLAKIEAEHKLIIEKKNIEKQELITAIEILKKTEKVNEETIEKSALDVSKLNSDINILQLQKKSLLDEINDEKQKIKTFKGDIYKKSTYIKEMSKQINNLESEKIKLVINIDALTKENADITAKCKKEKDILSQVNKRVVIANDKLTDLKEAKIMLIQKEERLNSRISYISQVYEKAGLTLKL